MIIIQLYNVAPEVFCDITNTQNDSLSLVLDSGLTDTKGVKIHHDSFLILII